MIAVIKDIIHNTEVVIKDVEDKYDILNLMKKNEDTLNEIMMLFIDADFQPLEIYFLSETPYCIKSEPGVGCIDMEYDTDFEYSDELDLQDVISEVFENDIKEYSRFLLEFCETYEKDKK